MTKKKTIYFLKKLRKFELNNRSSQLSQFLNNIKVQIKLAMHLPEAQTGKILLRTTIGMFKT